MFNGFSNVTLMKGFIMKCFFFFNIKSIAVLFPDLIYFKFNDKNPPT